MTTINQESTLHRLLDGNRYFSLTGKGTTNHCPMALCALAGMGASSARLRAFFAYWEDNFALPAPASISAIEPDQWPDAIADPAAFHSLQQCFTKWIDEAGCDAVVAEVLARCPIAPASVAFHALIRLGHGLAVRHSGEIGAGLAAFVSSPLILPSVAAQHAPAVSVSAGLGQLADSLNGIATVGGSINARLRSVVRRPDFVSACPAAPPGDALLDELADAAIRLVWQTDDFIALHMVTAVHAARELAGHLTAPLLQTLLPSIWVAYCAAYGAIGAPALRDVTRPEQEDMPHDWRPVLAAAIDSNDDHVIKLVHTCWLEQLRVPAALSAWLYYAVAVRAYRSPSA